MERRRRGSWEVEGTAQFNKVFVFICIDAISYTKTLLLKTLREISSLSVEGKGRSEGNNQILASFVLRSLICSRGKICT